MAVIRWSTSASARVPPSGLKAPVVVFTSDGGARLLSEALKAGVKGYVRKDSPSEDLIRARRDALVRLGRQIEAMSLMPDRPR